MNLKKYYLIKKSLDSYLKDESIFGKIDIYIIKNFFKIFDENKNDELSEIMSKYNSDKGYGLCNNFLNYNKYPPNNVCHNYTFFYNQLFNKFKNEKINIFEMGIGVPPCMGDGSWAGSLKGWKEYFIKSIIFSADIDTNYLYNDDRITSFFTNQEDEESIRNLWNNLSEYKFDLIIDDGPHTYSSQRLFFINSIYKLKKGGIFIIEDVHIKHLKILVEEIKSYCEKNKILVKIVELIIPYPSKFINISTDIMNMNNLIFIQKT